jgi:hypothetical protein
MYQNIEIIKSIPRLVKALATVGYIQTKCETKCAFVSSQYLKQSGGQYGGGAHEHHMNKWENSIHYVQHAISQLAAFDGSIVKYFGLMCTQGWVSMASLQCYQLASKFLKTKSQNRFRI